MLSFYEKRAKYMTSAQLNHALRDISATMAILRHKPLSDPYMVKLYAEFDAYTVELHKRQRDGRVE
jgi:hypothetical protein